MDAAPDVMVMVVCRTCRSYWARDADGGPACTDADHVHDEIELHRHRTPVTLPDGTTVVAASFDEADPYTRATPPDHGVYLDARWQPPWSHEHVDWPDFGVPADVGALRRTLADVRRRAAGGEVVELGCLGGHGRTGTALACLAVLAGHPPDEAVAWVRAAYCAKAVETDDQARLVAGFGETPSS